MGQHTYFQDPEAFRTALLKSDRCKHPPVTFLNAWKDFHTLGLPAEDIPTEFHCCRDCAIAYMTSFNIKLGTTPELAAEHALAVAERLIRPTRKS